MVIVEAPLPSTPSQEQAIMVVHPGVAEQVTTMEDDHHFTCVSNMDQMEVGRQSEMDRESVAETSAQRLVAMSGGSSDHFTSQKVQSFIQVNGLDGYPFTTAVLLVISAAPTSR